MDCYNFDTTKLNKIELIKLKKDGLNIFNDLKNYFNYETIPPEDLDLLKWAGVYVQRPRTDGRFMMRIKIPGGIMNSRQARTLAEIAQSFGKGILDLTTRQAIQFHGLTIKDLPDIIKQLEKVGLSSVEACGDCPRTIIGNPLSGIDPHENLETHEIVRQVEQYFKGNSDFSNLPRKFKISISGNIYNIAHAEINDLAFIPACKLIDGKEVQGFHVMVGGGLSAKPHLAQKLDLFSTPEEVLKICIGVATIFRDHGYREKRQHARLKFLVADWGPDRFTKELFDRVGPLHSSGKDLMLSWNAGYIYGIHKQKQSGMNYVGLSVPVGRLSAGEMNELADLAEKYGDSLLRTCNSKNIVLANIPSDKLDTLRREKLLQRLTPFPKPFTAYSIACTGKEFCNLALVETKELTRSLAQYLEQKIEVDTPIRIHINGCPNSCGQMHIADIGLQGALTRINDKTVEAFQIAIGGCLGPNPTFATKLTGFVPVKFIEKALEHLLSFFQSNKAPQESFNHFIHRVGVKSWQTKLDEFLDSNLQ